MRVIRASTLNRIAPTPIVGRVAQTVPWPAGGGRWRRIPREAIPPGLQSLQVHVPMRLATCEEVECPRYLRGWTEVATAGGIQRFVGHMTAEEVVGTGKVGMDGDRLPAIRHLPPGGACGEIHKVPSGESPVYIVDGRAVVESEFLDRFDGGVEAVIDRAQRG